MHDSLLVLIAAASVAAATPLLLAALGETVCELSGVQNLGVEGVMLIGAFCAFQVSVSTGRPWFGVAQALLVGALIGVAYAWLTVSLGVDQVVVGLALNMLAAGLTSYLGRSLVGQAPKATLGVEPLPVLEAIPVLGPILFRQAALTYVALVLAPVLGVLLFRTRLGLHLRAVGESPETADASGLPVAGYRFAATAVGTALSALAGAHISTVVAPAWTDNLTGGRGWIALALVIFAGWRPVWALAGAFLFGSVEAVAFHAQALGLPISSYILQTLPYLFTAGVLALTARRAVRLRMGAPAALGRTYYRE